MVQLSTLLPDVKSFRKELVEHSQGNVYKYLVLKLSKLLNVDQSFVEEIIIGKTENLESCMLNQMLLELAYGIEKENILVKYKIIKEFLKKLFKRDIIADIKKIRNRLDHVFKKLFGKKWRTYPTFIKLYDVVLFSFVNLYMLCCLSLLDEEIYKKVEELIEKANSDISIDKSYLRTFKDKCSSIFIKRRKDCAEIFLEIFGGKRKIKTLVKYIELISILINYESLRNINVDIFGIAAKSFKELETNLEKYCKEIGKLKELIQRNYDQSLVNKWYIIFVGCVKSKIKLSEILELDENNLLNVKFNDKNVINVARKLINERKIIKLDNEKYEITFARSIIDYLLGAYVRGSCFCWLDIRLGIYYALGPTLAVLVKQNGKIIGRRWLIPIYTPSGNLVWHLAPIYFDDESFKTKYSYKSEILNKETKEFVEEVLKKYNQKLFKIDEKALRGESIKLYLYKCKLVSSNFVKKFKRNGTVEIYLEYLLRGKRYAVNLRIN